MNGDDLRRLQEYRGFPALSLRLPTHRKMPESMVRLRIEKMLSNLL